MAPPEHWARYSGALFLGLALANWYAFRNPAKNVAVIQGIIAIWALTILVELYNGATGALAWELTLPGAIFEAIVTAGLIYFYPRGESPT